jgi:serine/threonine protein kinase
MSGRRVHAISCIHAGVTEATLMDDRRSERFGRYEILGELGRGAMGVVYKARDPKINRVVAVKTVSLSGQPPEEEREYRERFFREAEAAGRLSHPGIVTIFDVGEEPETRAPYIVMEFVDGPSLEKLLSGDNRTLSLEAALQLTLELAEALDCAHGQGVVHRDLKPANILVTEEGRAKIADFGVAKLNLANLTLAGRALGTPAYMSPEQLHGEEVDGRSDLFSLGVILYTVLTGFRPFQGNSAATVSFKVVNRDPIPATVLDTQLPAAMDYIIARAMAKDPAQRYQRGMEMALDIQELREGREPWSKTKQPGSFAGIDPAQTTSLRARAWATGQRGARANSDLSNRALLSSLPLGRDVVEKLLAKMRKNSLAGALLLIGLLLLGIGLSYAAWPPKTPAKSLAAAAPLKTLPPEAIPALPTQGTMPAHASAKPSPAMLDIEVDHKFSEAHLSIWVDDRLTYTHLLQGADKQHLVVFHHVEGHEFHAMQISAGKHRLRVRVTSGADSGTHSYDQSRTVAGEFSSRKENMLLIKFSKQGEMQLSLQ